MTIEKNIATTIDGWDPFEKNINSVMEAINFNTVDPDTCIILAGPPRVASIASSGNTLTPSEVTDSLYPLGLVEMVQVSSQRQNIPAKFVGSRRNVFLSQTALYQVTISRLLTSVNKFWYELGFFH